MFGFLKNLWDSNQREIKRLWPIVDKINSLEPEISKLSDAELTGKTTEFKDRINKGETLDDILPEAFAVVREASKRVLGMRHFDVQLIGGIVLHQGKISEMKTGEGKTLVATLPSYLNALSGKGVHVVTVNDYLARRDSEWMGKIHRFLGLNVGLIVHGIDHDERKRSYAADITYGTNNEFGFDYLRDNMAQSKEHMVQRKLNFAIVDEVDSILIDEARTPLIISGQADRPTDQYYRFAKVALKLKRDEDFTVDEKLNTIALTEEGVAKAEKTLGVENLYDDVNSDLAHFLHSALRAQYLMKRDRDYVVKDGEVIIVDEFTGRLMFGRRYSDGLHQAIEAKEGVKIERESQTLASITFQNYFRMYEKLAGMTGTAETEEPEFRKIYNLKVMVIPTNKPMLRKDYPDVIYKTEKAKFNAVIDEIVECNKRKQPVLVGTISIEKSELLSSMLQRRGVQHQVLNAKFHEKEAEIIALAGQAGAVTISTNMAGRGTDIVLGDGVAELGGLHVIGTERHESRRIDNQLRGRSGRQGDNGSSRFFLSLEDDLLRLFGGERIFKIMETIGMEEDQPIESGLVSRSIENAQRKVEARNFDQRRHVLEYDDIMNKQREVIYEQRRKVLEENDLREQFFYMLKVVLDGIVSQFANEQIYQEEWDLNGLAASLDQTLGWRRFLDASDLQEFGLAALKETVFEKAKGYYALREEKFGSEQLRFLEKMVMLHVIDEKWMDHLYNMDSLRQGVGLRAYGQKDPLMEYKFESYQMFQGMVTAIQEDIVRTLFHIQIVTQEAPAASKTYRNVREIHDSEETSQTEPAQSNKVGRNEACPCGSGKKYKKCCGQ